MIFLIITLLSLGYILTLYFLWIGKDPKHYDDYNKAFTVIIPIYNEGKLELTKCVESILSAKGNKQVILIDNNSNKPETIETIKVLKYKYKDLLVLVERRQGKRFAHSKGLAYAKNSLIVFVDSDTVVLDNTFLELIKPMQDYRIGAVCGNIKIANKNDNILTRLLDTMYWNSFEFYRQAVSGIGYLYVCSGALACYRKNLLLKLEKEYLNQKFMGSQCLISDDTFMTVRIQSRFGYKIAYQNNALAYTYSPNTFKGFWKQLVRWRQGFLRETLIMWREPKKNIIPLFIDAQVNLILQAFITFSRIFLIGYLIFFFSPTILLISIILFLLCSILPSLVQIVNRPNKIFYILGYSLVYDFVFIFTFIHALIKIRNQGRWGTR